MKLGVAAICGLALASSGPGQGIARITTLADEVIPAMGLASADGITLAARLPGGEPRTIALDDVVSIGFAAESIVRAPKLPGRVWLRSGSATRAELVGGDDRTARLKCAFGGEVDLAWVHLRALRFAELGEHDGAAMFASAFAEPLATEDILIARDRATNKVTRLSLHVLGIADGLLRVDFRGERSIPLDQVLGIVFGTENGAAPAAQTLPTVTLQLRIEATEGNADGLQEWTGKLATLDADHVRVQIPEGPTLALPRNAIASLTVRSSRVLWLSGIEPREVEQTAALDSPPALLRDAAPAGPGIVLDGRRFARGLCAVPRTRMTFDLPADSFDVLEATLGIDDRSTGPADAVIRIRVDGVVVLEREHVRRGTAEDIRVPLGSARTLTLEVDFGDHFDLGDHCVFAGARLLRS